LFRAARLSVAAVACGVLLAARSAHAQYVDSAATPATPPAAESAPANDAPPATDSAHEITVQGVKADTLKHASGSGTIIGKREIRNAQPESSAEMLRRVPGVQVRTETSPHCSRVVRYGSRACR